MRRLSMKRRKGKSSSSDNHSSDEEYHGNGSTAVAASSDEQNSQSQDNARATKKKHNKRAKKSGNYSEKVTDDEDVSEKDSNKRKKRSLLTTKPDEDEETEDYEVDHVVDSKLYRGRRLFKIRWKGFGPNNDSWEPEEDLNCPNLIQSYLDKNPYKDNSKNKKRGSQPGTEEIKKKKKEQSEGDDDDEDDNNENADNNEDDEEEDDDKGKEKVYEVEKVLEVHFKKNGRREFLIRWKGFTNNDDTWEPEQNLSCPDLIEKFMTKVDKAKSSSVRELRVNPLHTDRFTLNMAQTGRRLSRRNDGKQRATYYNYE